jgi:hypothetical protein
MSDQLARHERLHGILVKLHETKAPAAQVSIAQPVLTSDPCYRYAETADPCGSWLLDHPSLRRDASVLRDVRTEHGLLRPGHANVVTVRSPLRDRQVAVLLQQAGVRLLLCAGHRSSTSSVDMNSLILSASTGTTSVRISARRY